jgi:hypothetical protein
MNSGMSSEAGCGRKSTSNDACAAVTETSTITATMPVNRILLVISAAIFIFLSFLKIQNLFRVPR